MKALDAVEHVLTESGQPLHYSVITERILSLDLWQTTNKNPSNGIYADLAQDMKEADSRFERVGKGMFALRIWGDTGKVPGPKPDVPKQSKTLSFNDAAEHVLIEYADRKAMHYREITSKALELGLITTAGRTPENTLYSQIITEIERWKKRGQTPRFIKHGNGK